MIFQHCVESAVETRVLRLKTLKTLLKLLKTLLKMRVFNITGFQQVRKTVLSEDIFGSGASD